MEALLRCRRLHLYLAPRLFQSDGRAGRYSDRRLLGNQKAAAGGRRSIPGPWTVQLLEWNQPARSSRSGAGDRAGSSRLHSSGVDARRGSRESERFRPDLFLRLVLHLQLEFHLLLAADASAIWQAASHETIGRLSMARVVKCGLIQAS